jgi:putative flippase GtrA
MASSLIEHIRGSWRILVKEITAFGLVGAVGFMVDLGLFNLFFGDGQIVAKTISTTVATCVTYVGNRYLSFSHRARSKLRREAGFFFLINLIALLGSLVVIGIFSYPLHFKHHLLVMNLVNLFTIGMGTVFRFWAYKRFVFLHPDRVAANLPDLPDLPESSVVAESVGIDQPVETLDVETEALENAALDGESLEARAG